MSKVIDIVSFLEEKYPLDLGSNFDQGKIGLQFGSKNSSVKKVLITLDATTACIEEAVNNGCEMIITHHPFMFNSLLNLDYNSPFGKRLMMVFDNRLNIFAMHTNFDSANGGMNNCLADILGLNEISGDQDPQSKDNFLRMGMIEEKTLEEVAKEVKTKFGLDGVRVVGDLNKKVKKIGIIGGGGAIDWYEAKKNGCDCFITGEVRHNNALDAIDYNLGIIEVSHSAEGLYKTYIKNLLEENFSDVEFIIAKSDVEPFHYL